MTEPAPPTSLLCAPWTDEASVRARPKIGSTPSAELIEDAIAAAGGILYVLSGRRWTGGDCTATVLAAHLPRTRPSVGTEYDLGLFPVTDVSAVRVDGTPREAGTWTVRDRRVLVLPGVHDQSPYATNCLPGVPAHLRGCSPREVEADLTYGEAPPHAGVAAATALAAEFVLAWTASNECTLPKRVTSVTRQGVTAILLDPFTFLDKGKLGVYEVDLFLMTYNPTRRRRRAAVWSPDVQTARVL